MCIRDRSEISPIPLTLPLASNTAYCATAHTRDVTCYFHSSLQNVLILYNRPPIPPQNSHPMGMWTPSNTWFLGPTRVLNPNGIWIGSATFVSNRPIHRQTDRQTERQTDHATWSVTIGRIYVGSTTMWPKMNPKLYK